MDRFNQFIMFLVISSTLCIHASNAIAGANLTWQELEQALKENPRQLKSTEDVLNWIEERYPDFFTHHTLMQKSQSLQDASPLHPRAIVFAPNGQLVLTFNGHEHQSGFDRLELVAPDPDTKRFDFREITFSDSGAEISPPNPPKCARCHHSAPRPIWEPYRRWEGAFGFDDDFIAVNGPEHEKLKAFQVMAKTHARYSFLKLAVPGPVAPYAPELFYNVFELRPNLQLTKILMRRNVQRLIHRLYEEQHSCTEVLEELLAMTSVECFLFSNHRNELQGYLHPLFSYYEENVTPYDVQWHAHSNQSSVSNLAILHANGIDWSDWSLSMLPKYWSVSVADGVSTMSDFMAAQILSRLKTRYPVLEEYFQIVSINDPTYAYSPLYEEIRKIAQPAHIQRRDLLCSVLASGVQERFTEEEFKDNIEDKCFAPLALKSATNDREATLDMCSSCHSTAAAAAPHIPFDDQETLRSNPDLIQKIRARIAPDHERRMPPDRPLDPREYRAIKNFLDELSN